MPFSSDLRSGYIKMKFNMTWFWEMMKDMNQDIKFNGEEDNTEEFEYSIFIFEKYIEEKAYHYIIHSSFSKELHTECKEYDNIWIYLYECACEWVNNNKNKAIILSDDIEK